LLKENINDLMAFVVVAQERSFTRAAAKLGLSQSALSHTMKNLEARMGIRLLTRTTRSVTATEAGERLVQRLSPHFHEMENELNALKELTDTPAGNIKITAGEHAMDHYIWPVLSPFIAHWPDINVEVDIDNALTDIVSERFDAGIRLGKQIASTMIAVPVSPELRMAVVGSPDYFKRHPRPLVPADLSNHACINMRLPTLGGLCSWEFSKNGDATRTLVQGQITINSLRYKLKAVSDGMGLTYVPEDTVLEELRSGELVRVLDDWCEPLPGYYLYYPDRKQQTKAFSLLVDALRYKA
jgi:DNA-binding transcriptional LysR family regulator